MASSIGIIYASESKMIRAVVVPDTDAQLDNWPLSAGESLLVVDRSLVKSPDDVARQVEIATKQAPLDLTCAVVDKSGNVVGLLKADPAIDHHPDPSMSLVAAPDEVGPGCTYNAKTASFAIPQKIIPATTDKYAQPVAEQIIPAKTLASVDVAASIAEAQATAAVDMQAIAAVDAP